MIDIQLHLIHDHQGRQVERVDDPTCSKIIASVFTVNDQLHYRFINEEPVVPATGWQIIPFRSMI